MKYIKLITGVLMAIVLFNSCGSVPLTGRRQLLLVSDSELTAASLTQFDEYMRTAARSTDQTKAAIVQRVGRNIADATESYLRQKGLEKEISNFKWEFNLIRDDAVNAFAMPGGKIVVYEGIMPLFATEDELAVVVGHEIAHVIAKHSNERMSQTILAQVGATFVDMALSQKTALVQSLGNTVFGLGAQYGVMLPYSRKHEYEADHIGLILMTMAGYDPSQAVGFWQKMSGASGGGGGSDFMSTHPSDTKRIAELARIMPEMEKYKK